MRTNYLKMVFFALLLTVAFSCEKAIIDEEIDDTELSEPGDDDGGSGGGNGGGNTGKKDGRDENDPLTVAEFIAGDYELDVFVKGYIVGACQGEKENATFEAPFKGETAILLADNAGEKDTEKMISIGLGNKTSKLRKTFNLVDNPGNYGKQARFFGSRTTYLGFISIRNPGSYFLFD